MKLSELIAHLQGLQEHGDLPIFIGDMTPDITFDIHQGDNNWEPEEYPDGYIRIGEAGYY
ncbi:MAG: hypothetical protein HIU83_15145 [Proteobacteria bacterium]|nr:hypothetical protein [Pseudomonadota bacterium]